MNRTLNLGEHVLARCEQLERLGRSIDAVALLRRLVRFRKLPPRVAAQAHHRLAELYLRRRCPRRARRHLEAASRYQPNDARTHYLLGKALVAGPAADPGAALDAYQKSLELDPDANECRCALGILLARLGRMDEALGHLRAASQRAGDDVEQLGRVATGLRLAQQPDEARQVLMAARFRNPGDNRFRKLWNDFHFHLIRRDQQLTLTRKAAAARLDEKPVLLPFLRAVSEPLANPRVRRDLGGPLSGPRGILRVRRPDQRHAQ